MLKNLLKKKKRVRSGIVKGQNSVGGGFRVHGKHNRKALTDPGKKKITGSRC